MPLHLRQRLRTTACASSLLLITRAGFAQHPSPPPPLPPGALIDIGGQQLRLDCSGVGSPTVVLEAGAGDFGVVWSLIQPRVSSFTRVCSYDRGGYAWSDPGHRPRTYAQIALELHTALTRAHVGPPYVLVGQSYGGLLVRGFASRYRSEVVGMVLVDAVHEDQHIIYGGAAHRIRDQAQGRPYPGPRIKQDTAMIREAHATHPIKPEPLEPPLNRLPEAAQRIWRWASALPMYHLAQAAEMDWSPEELARMHTARLADRATLGDLPLIVLARTHGEYPQGVGISVDSLERERVNLQKDLAALSHRGRLVIAPHAGHNIQIEDPALVVQTIRGVVRAAQH